MQLPVAPPLVLAALLAVHPTAQAPADTALETDLQNVADTSDIAEVPAADVTAADPGDALPPTSPCPAYLGPQCDSVEHEQIEHTQLVDAQQLANLALQAVPVHILS
ncbi:hypothetical protein [Pseudonocardia sp. GCM10023141]|uniref:hypothetical protein n=1 Tax=Pseudonocardia sp. GCM10023141 TaxID=3252653 RepID=UPI0036221A34